MPKLNLNDSVLSDDFLVMCCEKLKLNGPTGVYQSIAMPVALLNADESFKLEL